MSSSPLNATAASPAAPGKQSRTIGSRHSLPGPRAVIGGMLVAVAMVGTYALAAGFGGNNERLVAVAATDLAAGQRLEPQDVRMVRTELGNELARKTVGNADVVIGATLLGPIRAGEVLQAGGLTAKTSAATQPEISFLLPSSRALGGNLSSGETVDVLVTDKSQSAVAARAAVTNAEIVNISSSGNPSLGPGGDITVTLAVQNRVEAAAVAAAIDTGNVTLVRTTGISLTEREATQ